ncbi:MAG: DNA alkylation repair protein, partial [Chloroflexi bacterium]|nr:DNA alkylation repair protein [Chloroflexota bacterium]
GPALVEHFQPTLKILASWREHPNAWVRRVIGVGAHVWAKRSRGAPELERKAGRLLKFLEPMLEEQEMDAVKGIGWGLKTLGKFYPETTTAWLEKQVAQRPNYRALILRKALTYLPAKGRARIARAASR